MSVSLHADRDESGCGKLLQSSILQFEFITLIHSISHALFAPSFVSAKFVVLISALFVFPPVDPVDTESTKMDSSFSLVGLSSSPKKRIRVECRCGSDSCRKYLF